MALSISSSSVGGRAAVGGPGRACGRLGRSPMLPSPCRRAASSPRHPCASASWRSNAGAPRASATAAFTTWPPAVLTPEGQRGVAADGLGGAAAGQLGEVRQRRVGEGVGGGVRHRAGHVADRVVHDPVAPRTPGRVGGLVGGLDAAALVDGDVDDHRAGLHGPDHVLARRRSGPGRPARAPRRSRGRPRRRCARPCRGCEVSVVMRPIWIWSTWRSRSMFLSSRSTSASRPAAIHAAFQPTLPAPSTTTRAGRTPGAPPSSTPRPPLWRSRKWAPTWTRHAAGDLAHRGEQRQRRRRRAAPSRRRCR